MTKTNKFEEIVNFALIVKFNEITVTENVFTVINAPIDYWQDFYTYAL